MGPCKCKKLDVVAHGFASGQITHPERGPAHLGLSFRWTITCTKGKGNCSGSVTVVPPAGTDVKITPKTTSFTCTGPCGGTKTGDFRMKAISADDLDFDKRAGKQFTFHLHKKCGKKTSVEPITLAFGSQGFLDKKKSDLNGNGILDGKEKK